MPSSSSRARVPARRSPRPAPRAVGRSAGERPLSVPIAAVFGLLTTGEDAYLAGLLHDLGAGRSWLTIVPALLAVLALAGATGVLLGLRPAWALLAVSAGLSLLAVLTLVVLLALLGGGPATVAAVLLLVGPMGALVLSLRRPVRTWTRPTRRPPGGRRSTRSAR